MEPFKNKYCLIALAIGLVVGFAAGMEYKAYQIRSVFNEATEELGNLFGGDAEDREAREKDQREDRAVKQAEADAKANETKRLRELVDVSVTDKGYTPSDIMNGRFESTIDFDFTFTNHASKDVQGVQGDIVFYDIFDNEIYRTNISFDKGVPADASFVWEAGLSYNEFIDEHVKLKSVELENLKYEWVPEMIIYTDGSREE
jgi:hypothetical protein